jgi:organic hydroperoxide reductase OsmC/OhrA
VGTNPEVAAAHSGCFAINFSIGGEKKVYSESIETK